MKKNDHFLNHNLFLIVIAISSLCITVLYSQFREVVDIYTDIDESHSVSGLKTNEIWDPPAINFFISQEEIANNSIGIEQLIAHGESLFEAKFNELDGAGRPFSTGDSKPTPRNIENGNYMSRISGPDAMACSSCHNQPKTGGSGDFVANVFVGAHFIDNPSMTIDPVITNERNTMTLFGSGLIELLGKEMTDDLHFLRENGLLEASQKNENVVIKLETKGINFGLITVRPNGTINYDGLEGLDYDLIVRPFGVKGVAASLREFSIAALNQHHGIQAIERFGWERTGKKDFDFDGVELELSVGQLTTLVLFQATLPPPLQNYSKNHEQRKRELLGRNIFEEIGCVICHKPSLKLESSIFSEPNKYNRPGTLKLENVENSINIDLLDLNEKKSFMVNAYTDLKRHNLCDDEINYFCNETVKQDNVDTELFLTAKLWDLSSSSPYGHRGDLRTISQAIIYHGGEARTQRDNFLKLNDSEKKSLIEFLLTLGND